MRFDGVARCNLYTVSDRPISHSPTAKRKTRGSKITSKPYERMPVAAGDSTAAVQGVWPAESSGPYQPCPLALVGSSRPPTADMTDDLF